MCALVSLFTPIAEPVPLTSARQNQHVTGPGPAKKHQVDPAREYRYEMVQMLPTQKLFLQKIQAAREVIRQLVCAVQR
jgi:hypothetical protein